ncbi:hypothetical protein LOK49_LG12G00685 [Camellia lanceoleosa]|uniref:Uncharacterized protein n=1 Tax=Camellia lanceoleosa TaxID=1840588 RepID=A0ACC0FT72_9ERIC|nr:hypothetical protein LOK49_LG12G00685 [Camellia lanceoleosa]
MGMAVSGVSVNMKSAAAVIPTSIINIDSSTSGLGMTIIIIIDLPLKIRRRKRINHQSYDRRHHRHESGERKLPSFSGETRRGQMVEGVGKDVDEAGGQNHTSGERLDDEEHVLFRTERRHGPAEYRKTDSDRSGDENRSYGRKFVPECLTLIVSTVDRSGIASTVSENCSGKNYEEGEKED